MSLKTRFIVAVLGVAIALTAIGYGYGRAVMFIGSLSI